MTLRSCDRNLHSIKSIYMTTVLIYKSFNLREYTFSFNTEKGEGSLFVTQVHKARLRAQEHDTGGGGIRKSQFWVVL